MTLDRNDNDAAFDRGRAVRFALVLAACIGGVAASAQSRRAEDSRLASVLGTDRDFAALAQETSLRAAFDRYLATTAVLLRPLPEPARVWLQSHEVASGRYDWSPAGAIVSCDGSLAVTLGRWQYVPRPGSALTAGEYLTAWRRNPEGDWQIVLDQAVELEPLDRIAQELQAHTRSNCQRSSASLGKLDALERRENINTRGGSPAATAGGKGTRVGTITGETPSDLVLTYGVLEARGATGNPGAVYVRLWQRARSNWMPLLEVVSPVEP